MKVIDEAKEKLCNRNCPFVKEIISLLDREKEFLSRGIKQSMSGLRNRLSHMFLHFLERNIDALDLTNEVAKA